MIAKRPDEIIAFVKATYGEISREDLKEFLILLGQTAIPDLRNLEAEVAAGNWSAAANAAHRVRNFTQAIGVDDLSESLVLMESGLRDGTGASACAQLSFVSTGCLQLADLVVRLAEEPENI